MRLRDQDMPLDPDVERELAAVDAGLTGLAVEPGLEDLAELAREARAVRPIPDPDLAAKLDEWAAAGFPRDGRPRSTEAEEAPGAFEGLRERLRALPPRRLVVTAGAAATLVVAVAVGVSVSDQLGGTDAGTSGSQALRATVPESSGVGGQADKNTVPEAAPLGEASGRAEDAARAIPFAERQSAGQLELSVGQAGARGGPRKVAQTAQLVLSTEPRDVRDVADGVVDVVDRYGGYVVSSNVTSGRSPGPQPVPEDGGASAQGGSGTFELRIPAQHLQAALGDMSDLAHVTSRTEGVKDITKRFDAAKARVHDLQVQRAHLLRQLAEALTITEQESIKERIRIVENQLADARDRYGRVQDRIRMVPVSVEVRGQAGVDDESGGAWGIGDAIDDAGRVLTVIAGILLVSAAVLVPLGLIGIAAWATSRAVMRRRREDALE